MRTVVKRLGAALAVTLAATLGHAADWTPPGPIKLMIGFAAGGAADTQARLIAEELEQRHGWDIDPVQVTGKGGLNLAAELKDAPADGTVIAMVVTETLGYNMAAASKAGMHPNDFTAITSTAGFQMGIVALSDKGWGSIEDAIAAGKAGQALRFGTMSPRLSDIAYLLGETHGVPFNIVQVRGGKVVLNGLYAGDLDLGFVAGLQSKGVAAGDLVNLASALPEPLRQSPDAPLLSDLGVPFSADGQFVFVAPAGLSVDARDTMAAAIAEVVSTPDTRAGDLIAKALGGPVIIAGDALQQMLVERYDAAGALLEAVSE